MKANFPPFLLPSGVASRPGIAGSKRWLSLGESRFVSQLPLKPLFIAIPPQPARFRAVPGRLQRVEKGHSRRERARGAGRSRSRPCSSHPKTSSGQFLQNRAGQPHPHPNQNRHPFPPSEPSHSLLPLLNNVFITPCAPRGVKIPFTFSPDAPILENLFGVSLPLPSIMI